METVIGAEEIDEAKFDVPVVRTSSTPSSPREIADPVVYQLVRDSVDRHKILSRKISVEVGQRVDGDGRLVPATDDEVMEVEDLLEDDKSEMHPVTDITHTVGCTSNDEFLSSKTQFNGSGQSENPKVDAEKSDALLDTGIGLGKLNAEPEETVPLLSTNSSDSRIDQPGNDGECSDPSDGTTKSVSVSVVCTSSKPDFSKLEGEICLDNLSVRELHETFKATFGRETSVKDKQWLKRRIAMGLTNSCDVSTTTFVIKDNKVVKKGKEGSFKTVDDTLATIPIVGVVKENSGGLPDGCSSQIEIPQNVSGKRLGNPCLEYDCDVEDLLGEQRAAKRVRKPTRRYIEELSEVESREYSGKLISSVKNSGHGQLSPRSRLRPVRDAHSDGRSLVTRQDSLGGWGFQVPYVCRVRRSRPRENFMALMKLQPSNIGVAAKLVKKALSARGAQSDSDMENKVLKARSASQWIQEPLVAEFEKDKNYQERIASELEKDVKLKCMDSSGDYSDDHVATVPTAKGGMRRKHHRPWTLSEVVKLVEGVARYGAGRWSEIKRLAFASYSHRTSVDLKDKWRNLLRASFAQSPPEKRMQSSRKHASVPIPAPILLRVKELAELQAQVPPNLSSSKHAAACSGRDVHETRSGYL